MAIVSTDTFYTTDLLYDNIHNLLSTYPFLQSDIIGYSVLGNTIPYIRIGRGSNQVFYSASIHANESINTNVLLKFIEDFCIAYINNSQIYGYSARSIFNRTSIYIVPMCNPDGVNLVNRLLPCSVVQNIFELKIFPMIIHFYAFLKIGKQILMVWI